MGSLLEVGTGFHPELTGRENIYLNGAILGMKRHEIRQRFDDIVSFAEVERFIDTPVKRYSSGMYLRLAFAVAAHLEPEILLVDEVLAVGDSAFQKKCLGKMSEVAQQGRTVVFVSHNMAAVSRLCERVILLEDGRIVDDGVIESVVNAYADRQPGDTVERSRARVEFPSQPALPMQVVALEVVDDVDGATVGDIDVSAGFRVRLEYLVREPIDSAYLMCAVTDTSGVDIIWTYDGDGDAFGNRSKGRFLACFSLPGGTLVPGRYSVRAAVVDTNRGTIDYPGHGPSFFVSDTDSLLAHRGVRWPGSCG